MYNSNFKLPFPRLVPHTCPKDQDVYQEYFDIRGQVALSRSDLLPINTVGQTCSKYGVHPDLSAIKRLYEENNLLFFANTGVMSQVQIILMIILFVFRMTSVHLIPSFPVFS